MEIWGCMEDAGRYRWLLGLEVSGDEENVVVGVHVASTSMAVPVGSVAGSYSDLTASVDRGIVVS